MKFTFDHDYHIHSQLSLCSNDPLQTPQRILEYAEEFGLHTVAVTDHFWDETVPGATDWYKKQDLAHVSASLPLPQKEGVRFLFGCETDLDRYCKLGISKECRERFDWILIPTTHLHMRRFTINETDQPSLKRRAKLWTSRMEAVLAMDLPFSKVGIAHPACGLMVPWDREEYLECLEMIPDAEMEAVFSKAASLGVGIELNQGDMSFADGEAEVVLRPFRIAKRQGCKFFCGSDAHHPAELQKAKAVFERAVDYLGLQESDKFHIGE